MSTFSEKCYRLYRVAGRTLIKYSGNPRPASFPYISGDGFRAIADHIYDSTRSSSAARFNPKKIKEKEIVFVGDNMIRQFLRDVHPRIAVRYILVTHNGDEKVDAEVAALIEAADNIIKCYSYNVVVSHPKIVPIPLGIENKHFYVQGIPFFLKRAAKNAAAYPEQKKDRIFYRFTLSANADERKPALDALQKNKYAETTSKWLIFPDYLKLISGYKFAVSPHGSSVERHLAWDAHYLGIIPIVTRSVIADYLKKCGVPLWIIEDWHELDRVDEKTLHDRYADMMSYLDRRVLFMDYWIDKIKNVKD